MSKKYHKNFILCGELDYHCLLCKETFNNVDNVEKHIRWETHKKSLKEQSFYPKLRKEFIYKFQKSFYCEICNFTALNPDDDEIIKHINDENHKTNKNSIKDQETPKEATFKYDSSGGVLYENMIISKSQWHGVELKRCALCEESIANIDFHIYTPKHMINLIQAKFKFENNDCFYRLIGDSIAFCMKCKEKIPLNLISEHWIDQKHTGSKNIATLLPITTDIINVPSLQQNSRDISQDNADVQLIFYDHGKRRADLAKYGRENFIIMNCGGSKGYCTLCSIKMSGHMNIFTGHVNGNRHTLNLEARGIVKAPKAQMKLKYKTKPIKEFIQSYSHCSSKIFFCINEDIYLYSKSFLLVSPVNLNKIDKRMKCFACDTIINIVKDKDHIKTKDHKRNLVNAPIISSFKGDFIREINTKLYHCGMCNEVFPSWSMIQHHTNNDFKHKQLKNDMRCHIMSGFKSGKGVLQSMLKVLETTFP